MNDENKMIMDNMDGSNNNLLFCNQPHDGGLSLHISGETFFFLPFLCGVTLVLNSRLQSGCVLPNINGIPAHGNTLLQKSTVQVTNNFHLLHFIFLVYCKL